MGKVFSGFWRWYERHLVLNTVIAAGLFTLQLVHLYWLSADVVALRLFDKSFFPVTGFWQTILVLVDYTEIPAIFTTSVLYINQVRKGQVFRGLLFLFFLNSQWLHIFWITDEFVVEYFQDEHQTILAGWLAWVAIAIDYLELPVIFDIFKKVYATSKKEGGLRP